jgi:hypothetical protein
MQLFGCMVEFFSLRMLDLKLPQDQFPVVIRAHFMRYGSQDQTITIQYGADTTPTPPPSCEHAKQYCADGN